MQPYEDPILHNKINVFLSFYGDRVGKIHPKDKPGWPLYFDIINIIQCDNGWTAFILTGKGLPKINKYMGSTWTGVNISLQNIEEARTFLENKFNIAPNDAVVIFDKDNSNIETEIKHLMFRHEQALGLTPMKIFLSHRTPDKPRVARIYEALKLLGFDPWLDTEEKTSGNIDRKLISGMENSCAVVFFLTSNFEDRGFLENEINMAISRKRELGDKFEIIVVQLGAEKVNVPVPIKDYIRHTPSDDLDCLKYIIKGLPIEVGKVHLRAYLIK